MAVSPEQLAANLRSAENLARSRAGLPAQSQLADVQFTYEQRIAYNKELAKIIAQYPDRFTPALAKTAADVTAKTYEPLESQSLGQSVGIFAAEVGRQAVAINAALNPLAEENRGATASTLKWLLIALAIGGVVIYFGPALLEGGHQLKRRTKTSTNQ